jgi:hypothetical protein
VTVITVVLATSSRDGSAQEFAEFKVFIETLKYRAIEVMRNMPVMSN